MSWYDYFHVSVWVWLDRILLALIAGYLGEKLGGAFNRWQLKRSEKRKAEKLERQRLEEHKEEGKEE